MSRRVAIDLLFAVLSALYLVNAARESATSSAHPPSDTPSALALLCFVLAVVFYLIR
jgi:hypothetical protein